MSCPSLKSHVERELKYQARREISYQIRRNVPKGDPMVTGITVMLGTVLAIAALNAILYCSVQGRKL